MKLKVWPTYVHCLFKLSVHASQYVWGLGQLVLFLNSQSHQITHCSLQGANSSHKMLKHYLGGRKQLDSVESDASRHAATGMREWGCGGVGIVGKRNCVKCITRCTWRRGVYGSVLPIRLPNFSSIRYRTFQVRCSFLSLAYWGYIWTRKPEDNNYI